MNHLNMLESFCFRLQPLRVSRTLTMMVKAAINKYCVWATLSATMSVSKPTAHFLNLVNFPFWPFFQQRYIIESRQTLNKGTLSPKSNMFMVLITQVLRGTE